MSHFFSGMSVEYVFYVTLVSVPFVAIFCGILWSIAIYALFTGIFRDISLITETDPPPRFRSVRVLGAVAGWFWVIAVAVLYGLWCGASLSWIVLGKDYLDVYEWRRIIIFAPLVFGSLFTFIFFGFYALATVIGRNNVWSPTGYKGVTLLAFLTLAFFIFTQDCPPVRSKYTWNNLPAAPKDAKKSYACLLELMGTNVPTLKAHVLYYGSDEMGTNILAKREEIEKAWADVAPGWETIKQLNTYEQIAELPEWPPHISESDSYLHWSNLRLVINACGDHALLRVAQDRSKEGVNELLILHSVARKTLPRTLVSRMMWLAVTGYDMRTAIKIARNPNCTPESLRLLRDGFSPLGHSDTTMKAPFITQYAWMDYFCSNYVPDERFLDSFRFFVMGEVVSSGSGSGSASTSPADRLGTPASASFLGRGFSRLLAFVTYDRNRTLRDLDAYYSLLIEESDRHPPDCSSSKGFMREYEQHPRWRNIGGWMLLKYGLPDFSKAISVRCDTKVRSDLLAIELARRSGERLELPDYMTNKGNYLTDEATGEPFSPGADGIPGTKDDIRLINL